MLKPLSSSKWNYDMAAHLLNRAGFGGPPVAIQQLADLTMPEAVSSLIDYERIPDPTPAPDWAHPEPDRLAAMRQVYKTGTPDEKREAQHAEQKLQYTRMIELRGWWLNRMARGPRPFQEKMTLFWHGHFATSIEKVHEAYYMWRQNELFRRLATDNWTRLLLEMGKDPAMLVWLDQAESRKEHANENFAREVMELFALGIGNYTEKDVTEGARALTGWSLDRMQERYVYRPEYHDEGIKTYLGLTGNLNGDDVIAQIVAQPASEKFITAKIWNYFAGQMPSPQLNEALAEVLRYNGNNFKPFLRVMFSSEEFYSPDIVKNEVKSPTVWLVGSARMLQSDLPPPLICMAMLRSLGQDLFAPPNVKGWDGGLSWITTNTLLARYNQAAVLVSGSLEPLANADFSPKGNGKKNPKAQKRMEKLAETMRIGGVDVNKILTPEERADKDLVVASVEHRLLQSDLSDDQENALRDFLDSHAINRWGHPYGHPLSDVHALLSSNIKPNQRPSCRQKTMKDEITLQTRRQFLRTTVLGGALSWTVPAFLANTFAALQTQAEGSSTQITTGKDGTILVVLQMAGGNDGINTVVPYSSDYYRQARPRIGLSADKVLKLSDDVGFHPAMTGFKDLFDSGNLSVVQGVGYPNPNRSHFRSTEIWQTASDSDKFEKYGWIGRYFDNDCAGCDPAVGVAVEQQLPQSFYSQSSKGVCMTNPQDYRFQPGDHPRPGQMDMVEASYEKLNDINTTPADENSGGSIGMLTAAMPMTGGRAVDFIERTALDAQMSSTEIRSIAARTQNQAQYPASQFGNSLKLVAKLIGGGLPTRIYYVSQGGYDTHTNQLATQQRLLADLGDSMKSFVDDLKAQGNMQRVLVMTFSEFGRRVTENANGGTDHGAAAPIFIVGNKVKAGLLGAYPSLAPQDLFEGDIKYNVDFRSVYAAVLENWLKTKSAPVLGRQFTPLPIV